jgi:type II secretory pathway pseudopilin PulG
MHGFSIIEVLVMMAVVLIAASLCLAAQEQNRRAAQQEQNSTQLRGIHQGMIIYAQANKAGSKMGWFPGVSAEGEIKQTEHGPKFKIMIESNIFTSAYIINPRDKGKEAWEEDDGDLTTDHYSYAMLRVEDVENDKGRYQEWRETINTRAIVLSDRNTKAGDERGSVWTDGDPERKGWHGSTAYNDNSTRFEETHIVADTKYGVGKVNEQDDLFAAASKFDAMMTYGKAPEEKLAHR